MHYSNIFYASIKLLLYFIFCQMHLRCHWDIGKCISAVYFSLYTVFILLTRSTSYSSTKGDTGRFNANDGLYFIVVCRLFYETVWVQSQEFLSKNGKLGITIGQNFRHSPKLVTSKAGIHTYLFLNTFNSSLTLFISCTSHDSLYTLKHIFITFN